MLLTIVDPTGPAGKHDGQAMHSQNERECRDQDGTRHHGLETEGEANDEGSSDGGRQADAPLPCTSLRLRDGLTRAWPDPSVCLSGAGPQRAAAFIYRLS